MRTLNIMVEQDPGTGLSVGYVPGWPDGHSQGGWRAGRPRLRRTRFAGRGYHDDARLDQPVDLGAQRATEAVGIRYLAAARPHQSRWCYGKTPLQTFLDCVPSGPIEVAGRRGRGEERDPLYPARARDSWRGRWGPCGRCD
jgi:hypothetical protein